MDYGKVDTLSDLNNGIIGDMFPDAWREILENISDENTPATARREVRIVITITPTKDRDAIDTGINVSTKLSPPKESTARLLLSNDGRETTAHYRIDEPKQKALDIDFPKSGGNNA